MSALKTQVFIGQTAEVGLAYATLISIREATQLILPIWDEAGLKGCSGQKNRGADLAGPSV
jgi:hypothetical protein